jgi:hypothetical protein
MNLITLTQRYRNQFWTYRYQTWWWLLHIVQWRGAHMAPLLEYVLGQLFMGWKAQSITLLHYKVSQP